MLKNAVAAASIALGLLATPAHAIPITYDLTLNGVMGNVAGGTGSFTVQGPINAAGNQTFSVVNGLLLALSFDIDGRLFDLSDATNSGSQVLFQNGNLTSVNYVGTEGSILVSMTTGALFYIYADLTNGRASFGGVGGSVAPVRVPEPATWVLLSAGLIGMGLVRRRRRNT